MTSQSPVFEVTATPVDGADAAAVLREYFTELGDRYHGRRCTAREVDAAMAEDPSTDLRAPRGLFLLARQDGAPAGCVGVRLLAPGVTELKRMYVRPWSRGQGLGARLLAAAEQAAAGLGATVMRLDTRHDLVEARGLYVRSGYREIAPYSRGPYADLWFEKRLTPGPAPATGRFSAVSAGSSLAAEAARIP